MDREAVLKKAVSQNGIFENRVDNPVIGFDLDSSRGVYSGIGLANSSLSKGLPVDSLLLVFGQEIIKRSLDLDSSHLLIADSNALTNGLDRKEVERAAQKEKELLQDVIEKLGFDYNVILASDIEKSRPFEKLRRSLRAVENDYIGLQLCQTAFFEKEYGVNIKVGWAMADSSRDERYFDRLLGEALPRQTFVYTKCGRTCNPSRPRAPPYICEDESERILLGIQEDAEVKLRGEGANAYRNLLRKLVRAYSDLTGDSLDGKTDEKRIQSLLDRIGGVHV